MLSYAVELSADDNGTVLARMPEFPEVVTYGEDEAEALARVGEVLEDCLAEYVARRMAVPRPKARGGRRVRVAALTETKLQIHAAMLRQGVGKAELARRLGCHLPQVDRALDLHHHSRLDLLEKVLAALGKRLVVRVEDAA